MSPRRSRGSGGGGGGNVRVRTLVFTRSQEPGSCGHRVQSIRGRGTRGTAN